MNINDDTNSMPVNDNIWKDHDAFKALKQRLIGSHHVLLLLLALLHQDIEMTMERRQEFRRLCWPRRPGKAIHDEEAKRDQCHFLTFKRSNIVKN